MSFALRDRSSVVDDEASDGKCSTVENLLDNDKVGAFWRSFIAKASVFNAL